jgi:hypothetical protein
MWEYSRPMPRSPAAMLQLADLKAQLGRIERLRLRLIDGQAVQMADMLLLIDRASDGITAEMRAAKARLQRARAA